MLLIVKKIIPLLSLLLLFSACGARMQELLNPTYQSSYSFSDTYDEFLEADEEKIRTWYHYVQTINSEGEYIMRLFFPETKQMTFKETYQSEAFEVLHGPYESWWDNGNKRSKGQFKEGVKEGFWQSYAWEEGLISREGDFANDQQTGLWKFYDSKGRIKENRHFLNGIAEGEFIVYDTLGTVFKKGIYKSDTIFSEQLMIPEDSEQDERSTEVNKYIIVEEMPSFPGGDQKMLEYLYGNIKYPPIAREYGVQGACIASFVINEKGAVSEIVMRTGLCQSIKEECIRILNAMPDWEPGYQDGKAVRVSYNLPIRFKLQ